VHQEELLAILIDHTIVLLDGLRHHILKELVLLPRATTISMVREHRGRITNNKVLGCARETDLDKARTSNDQALDNIEIDMAHDGLNHILIEFVQCLPE
jgi:hypothetical protein